MKEQLITFEIAKLAKEKGFDIECVNRYKNNGILNDYTFGETYSAPTQSLLQKWLREEREIHVEVDAFSNSEEYYYYFGILTRKNGDWIRDGKYRTYEDALEQGLKEALKLINNNT